eukprot:TRINITY_DN10404_c0_g1_i1.p1 TRINITY_DN10404_c0_g1~~TRINITY_DN10404_c0_g1_i1.p1  ORF type:complete len:630 (-),score=97.86 TRINITY_DN10404_c0_g1_i1:61-1950(-)
MRQSSLRQARSMPSFGSAPARLSMNDSKDDSTSQSEIRPRIRKSFSMLNQEQSMRYLMLAVPFIAMPGMGDRLKSVSKNLSRQLSRGALARDLPIEGIEEEEGEDLLPQFIKDYSYTGPLMLAVFVAMLGSFQFGYNSGVINVPEKIISSELGLSQFEWALVVSIFCIGGLLGSYMGGYMADRIGRKSFLLTNNIIFIAAGLLQGLATNIFMLSAGRLLVGIGSGGASVVVPLYLGEISPANLRGALGTFYQLALVIGILISNLLGRPLGQPVWWRFLLALIIIPAFIQIILSPFLCESPRWLASQDRIEEAHDVLVQLRGSEDIDYDMDCIEASKQEEQGGAAVTMTSLLMNPMLRLPLMIALFLNLAQQFSGINAVFYYSASFFKSAKFSDPWLGSVLASVVNVLATALAIPMMDRLGRRTLLLASAGFMAVSCFSLTGMLYWLDALTTSSVPSTNALPEAAASITASSSASGVGIAAVCSVLLFVSFFEIGLGPIAWLISAEIFPSRERAMAMAAACGFNWICNFIVGLGFPFMNSELGNLCFVPFGAFLMLSLIFVAYYVPETKGKTLEEIQQELKVMTVGEPTKESVDEDDLEDRTPRSINSESTSTAGYEIADQYGNDDDFDR